MEVVGDEREAEPVRLGCHGLFDQVARLVLFARQRVANLDAQIPRHL
jgi:hypothetical protein